jgi:hypothetical protein
VTTKKILGLMLLAMLFVTVAGLYATGPKTIYSAPVERHCTIEDSGGMPGEPCWNYPSHDAAAWERVWFAVVGKGREVVTD